MKTATTLLTQTAKLTKYTVIAIILAPFVPMLLVSWVIALSQKEECREESPRSPQTKERNQLSDSHYQRLANAT